MLAGSMVEDHVHEDTDVALMAFLDELGEIHPTDFVLGIDGIVVLHVIAMVVGRRVARRKPDAADAEVFEVVKVVDNAFEIPDAIAISIREGIHEQLIPGTMGVI